MAQLEMINHLAAAPNGGYLNPICAKAYDGGGFCLVHMSPKRRPE
jgi:hypothetical protein